jgi:hypothetical protein
MPTKHRKGLASYAGNSFYHGSASPWPITTLDELRRIYESLDDKVLTDCLRQYRWTGRPGYSVRALWRSYLAGFALNLPSTNALVRRLQEDEQLAAFCGFEQLPSRWTFNRFVIRLSRHLDLVEGVLTSATREIRDRLQGAFGYMMAVDATVVRTCCSPSKNPVSDPEASWTVKGYKARGVPDWQFGFKLHLVADADTELPIAAIVTTASVNDTTQLLALLAKAQAEIGIKPHFVLADAGYDSNANFGGIVQEYAARPNIKVRRTSRKDLRLRQWGTVRERISMDSPQWKAAYRRRQAVERVFSRLKGHRALGQHCRRGLAKVTLHCLSAILVAQAEAAGKLRRGAFEQIRTCTRKIA